MVTVKYYRALRLKMNINSTHKQIWNI